MTLYLVLVELRDGTMHIAGGGSDLERVRNDIAVILGRFTNYRAWHIVPVTTL